MNPNDYQNEAAKTAIYPPVHGIPYCIMGLTNEAGEVAGKYKKHLRDCLPFAETKEKLLDELGDVLWYAANLARELETPLEDVMQRNLHKLRDRADRGVLAGDGDKR